MFITDPTQGVLAQGNLSLSRCDSGTVYTYYSKRLTLESGRETVDTFFYSEKLSEDELVSSFRLGLMANSQLIYQAGPKSCSQLVLPG